jgi:hypothetical protein
MDADFQKLCFTLALWGGYLIDCQTGTGIMFGCKSLEYQTRIRSTGQRIARPGGPVAFSRCITPCEIGSLPYMTWGYPANIP